jgi:DNA invertase Pin-like site-specific DNA recombinase
MGKRIPVFNEIAVRRSSFPPGLCRPRCFLSLAEREADSAGGSERPARGDLWPVILWAAQAVSQKRLCRSTADCVDNQSFTDQNKASQKRMFVRRYGIVKNNGMRVALYARVSTKDKRQDTENQLTQLRQFTVTQGWAVAAEYVDRATGKHSDREQFQRLFEDASQRKFDLVLFWSLDRFSREGVRETLNHLERLSSYGVAYRSFTEQYLDSCGLFKDAVLAILAVIAKQERVRLSERTIAGLEKARKAGRVGGRPKVVCDRRKVERLRQAGLSLSAIARKVKVSKSTIHRMLG